MDRVRFISLTLVVLLLAGCSNDSTTSAQFAASQTPAAPGLVQLAQSSISGTQVRVNVLLHGPEPDLDLAAYRFAIRISDTSVLRFVPQSTYEQSALVAGEGQTIQVAVNTPDPSVVEVQVKKRGGGAGNGFASPAAVLIGLTFEVLGSGGATLSFAGVGASPPQVFDSTGSVIDDVIFDVQSATVAGVRTGGGGY